METTSRHYRFGITTEHEGDRNRTRARDYYMLKANLEDAYVDGEGKLVVVFGKWNDPQLSARYLKGMRGFVVCHFKKP